MKDIVKAFVGGILFTLILVIVIPVVTTVYMQPIIEEEVNSLGIAIVSSSVIISVIMLIITLCFGFLFGGGAILRNFGIVGVLGLIFAYWFLGNIYGAVIPVATLILFAILKRLWEMYKKKGKKEKKKKDRKGR